MNSSSDSSWHPGILVTLANHLVRAIIRRFRDGRCAQVAGSLAFTTLLSLVPFVTLVAVMFSQFPESSRFGEALKGFLLDYLLPDKAGQVVATYALQFSQKATNLTIAGVLMLVLTALMLMRTIDQVINQIWRVRSTRAWATRLAVYWMALSVGPLFLAVCVFASSAMLGMSLDLFGGEAWLEAFALRLVPVLLLTGLFSTIYYAVPHCTVRLVDALIAGLFAATAFLVMQRLFGLYLKHFPSYTLVYGAFAAVPIFLLWLYLSWIVILLGAVIAAVLPERAQGGRPLPQFAGRRAYLALWVLAQLARAQREGLTRDVAWLSRLARTGNDELREILEICQRKSLVARSDHGGWMLLRAAEHVSLISVTRLFAWDMPTDMPVDGAAGGEDAAFRAQWRGLLDGLDAAVDKPLSALIAAEDQSG